jgi:uncharacterized membrane protein YraQ (UPF0718 family)
LLLGMLLSGLLHVFLPADFIRKKLTGFSGVVKAVGLGVPLPLCSCGVIPAGIGLKNQGASSGAAVGFLISTPQTGVESIFVSAAFLGWPFAIFKMFTAVVLGLIGGCLTDYFERSEGKETSPALRPSKPESIKMPVSGLDRPSQPVLGNLPVLQSPPPNLEAKQVGLVARMVDLVFHGVDILRSIWIWLLIGILVSAAIETIIPQEWLQHVSNSGLWVSMLLALALSVPIYVCTTASVPIAASMVQGGFAPAAAIVFLIAGPATNVSSIGAIYGRFGFRTALVYLLTIVLGSMIFALLFHWLLEIQIAATGDLPCCPSWLAVTSGAIVVALMATFAIQSVWMKWIK